MTVSHFKNLLCLFQSLQEIFEYKIYSLIYIMTLNKKFPIQRQSKKLQKNSTHRVFLNVKTNLLLNILIKRPHLFCFPLSALHAHNSYRKPRYTLYIHHLSFTWSHFTSSMLSLLSPGIESREKEDSLPFLVQSFWQY